MANVLVERGHNIVATDIKPIKHNWPDERALVLALDVTDADAWERALSEAVARFNSIDVHMNIAGYLKPGHFQDMPAQEVHRHLDINVKGVMFGTQVASRLMIKQGYGHIINIASMAGLAPIPGLAFYSASKFAVRSFSLAAAFELRPHNVFVTAICPDGVKTPMLDVQQSHEESALTFSGPRILTVQDIEYAILHRALHRKPLEIYIPLSRGFLARLGDLFPRLGFLLIPILSKRGRKRQLEYPKKGNNA